MVYGTGSANKDCVASLQAAAVKVSACGGAHEVLMQKRFPVISDTALTEEQEANCNLILLGTPDENAISKKIFPKLPITIRNNNLLSADRPPLPLKGQVLSVLYPHPNYPARLVYLVAPFTDSDGLERFCEAPQRFLEGSDGFDRVSQADLSVQNLDNEIGRQMQFGKNWEWINQPDSDRHIPACFRERSSLAAEYIKIMRQKSGADFAFWWGPADKGFKGWDVNYLKCYNPDFYTLADFRTQHHIAETMTGSIPGNEWREIWNRWIETDEIQCYPELVIDSIVDDRLYTINIPVDLYMKLGQRKKNLIDPKPGPSVRSEELVEAIFSK